MTGLSTKQHKNSSVYIAIDLKSFYASVECRERELDPLTTNLVVADESRTEKTICLAVSPTMKAYGIPGRARFFEVVQKIRQVNQERKNRLPDHTFSGSSCFAEALAADPSLSVDYIVAKPRMAFYMDYSTRIYQIYTKFIAPEDIHVYSIDEVFMDVTKYLPVYKKSPRDLAMTIIRSVLEETGITATAGIGPNLYLCKIAMDIVAKHILADENGVRIAELDEMEYRKQLWEHRPLTDFWRVGAGISRKLEARGLYTMGDIACCSLGPPYSVYNEDTLYKMFGVNAELLIDHAWGWEPCTIRDIKAFKPENDSLSSGQVLQSPYPFDKAKLIVKEMTDALVLELVDKHLKTDQIVLTVCYDTENLKASENGEAYQGEIETDRYGRKVPKPVHGSVNLGGYSSSTKLILEKTVELYDRIADPRLSIRRIYVVANHLMDEASVPQPVSEQMDFFTDYRQEEADREAKEKRLAKEEKQQKVLLEIRRKFGKNAILKGMNLEEGATGKDRNEQIGGHKA